MISPFMENVAFSHVMHLNLDWFYADANPIARWSSNVPTCIHDMLWAYVMIYIPIIYVVEPLNTFTVVIRKSI